jgi:general secretion pathway protein G
MGRNSVTGTEQHRRRRAWAGGFTLIELLVVVSLVMILAGIGMVQYRTGVTRAQEAVLREDLYRMRDVIDQFYADKQKYPQTLEELVEGQYLREIPKDPFTGSADTWQLIQAEPDPANPAAELGISNVRSGSERTALDGVSKYSDW